MYVSSHKNYDIHVLMMMIIMMIMMMRRRRRSSRRKGSRTRRRLAPVVEVVSLQLFVYIQR